MASKFCTDCKHHAPLRDALTLWMLPIAWCRHPKQSDLVRNVPLYHCDALRQAKAPCGPSGRLWEPVNIIEPAASRLT